MKKILVLVTGGRPRGNTRQLADAFAQGAREAGHEVQVLYLQNKEIRGCLGCNACRYGKPCVQKDDFAALVPHIAWCDTLVFASPLYFWTICARMKAILERFYSLAQPDDAPPLGRYEAYPKKDCALLMTAADDLFWTFEQAVSYYRFALVNYIGFADQGRAAGGRLRRDGRPAAHWRNRPPCPRARIWPHPVRRIGPGAGRVRHAAKPQAQKRPGSSVWNCPAFGFCARHRPFAKRLISLLPR